MVRIPPVIPRRIPLKERSGVTGPAFLTTSVAEKHLTRERTARFFAEYLREWPAPVVLCMPHYDALCAKAINALLPQAVFHGVERDLDVAENVAEVVPGKKITMHKMPLRRLISATGSLRFDAAFIDYYGTYSSERMEELAQFAVAKMQPDSVLAVTMQGFAENVSKVLPVLQTSFPHAAIVAADNYQTSVAMCHVIFCFKKDQFVTGNHMRKINSLQATRAAYP